MHNQQLEAIGREGQGDMAANLQELLVEAVQNVKALECTASLRLDKLQQTREKVEDLKGMKVYIDSWLAEREGKLARLEGQSNDRIRIIVRVSFTNALCILCS